jgi:phage tail-like protein
MQDKPGRLLSQLPWVYHASAEMRTLLGAFEDLLFGPCADEAGKKPPEPGLEQKIASIPRLFAPASTPTVSGAAAQEAPAEFLPWLSQWVALSQYHGLSESQRRALICNSIPLYAERGTKGYLEQMLQYFVPQEVTITINDQEQPSMTVGISKVGVDSLLGGDRPYWFSVKLDWPLSSTKPEAAASTKKRYAAAIRSVINLAKPAHTMYRLEWVFAGGDAEQDQ